MACKDCSLKIKNVTNISNGVCENCNIRITAYNRYWNANVPVEYWGLSMDKHFSGSADLLKSYQGIVENLARTYDDGKHVMFAGTTGVGKTMACCNILKKACHKNYNALYTTLSDIISTLIDGPHEERFMARAELLQTDFLVIDEFDPRYIGNGASDLFGRTVENVLRARIQNGLPTFICTNSPNPIEAFQGSIKDALSSLMNKIKMVPILAKDFRKE